MPSQTVANIAVTVTDNVTVPVNVIEPVIKKELNNNIKERKLKFSSTLEPFLIKYGKEMLNDFYKYWTEPNKTGTKFRQESEKFWDLEKRLNTWAAREKTKFNSTIPEKPKMGKLQANIEAADRAAENLKKRLGL